MKKIIPVWIIFELILNFFKCYGNDENLRPIVIGGYPTCLTDLDATYCDLDRSYPEEIIDASLVTSPFYTDTRKFIEDKISTENRSVADVVVDKNGNFAYFTRIEHKFQSTCSFKEYLTIPSVAKSSVTKSWVYTVNTPKYKQEYKGQKCAKNGVRLCQEDAPTNHEEKCIQRFEDLILLAINPANKQPMEDKFTLPSHCECDISSSIFFRERNSTALKPKL